MEVIQHLVKEGLVESHTVVRDAIVSGLVKEELDRRIRATTAVFQKIKQAEGELKKIKPTFLGFDDKGAGKGEAVFTKEQADQRKKLNEQLEKLNGALKKALVEKDFGKVFELGQ